MPNIQTGKPAKLDPQTIFLKILDERVPRTILTKDNPKTISKREAVIQELFRLVKEGDSKALKFLLSFVSKPSKSDWNNAPVFTIEEMETIYGKRDQQPPSRREWLSQKIRGD